MLQISRAHPSAAHKQSSILSLQLETIFSACHPFPPSSSLDSASGMGRAVVGWTQVSPSLTVRHALSPGGRSVSVDVWTDSSSVPARVSIGSRRVVVGVDVSFVVDSGLIVVSLVDAVDASIYSLLLSPASSSSSSSSMALRSAQLGLLSVGSFAGPLVACHFCSSSSNAGDVDVAVLSRPSGGGVSVASLASSGVARQVGIVTVYQLVLSSWRFDSMWALGRLLPTFGVAAPSMASASPSLESRLVDGLLVTVDSAASSNMALSFWSLSRQSSLKSLPLKLDRPSLQRVRLSVVRDHVGSWVVVVALAYQTSVIVQVFVVQMLDDGKSVTVDELTQSEVEVMDGGSLALVEVVSLHGQLSVYTSPSTFLLSLAFQSESAASDLYAFFDRSSSSSRLNWSRYICGGGSHHGPVVSLSSLPSRILINYGHGTSSLFTAGDQAVLCGMLDGSISAHFYSQIPGVKINCSRTLLMVTRRVYAIVKSRETSAASILLSKLRMGKELSTESLRVPGRLLLNLLPVDLRYIIERLEFAEISRFSSWLCGHTQSSMGMRYHGLGGALDSAVNGSISECASTAALIVAFLICTKCAVETSHLKRGQLLKCFRQFDFYFFCQKSLASAPLPHSLSQQTSNTIPDHLVFARHLVSLIEEQQSSAFSALRYVPKEGLYIYPWALYHLKAFDFSKSRELFIILLRNMVSVSSPDQLAQYELLEIQSDQSSAVAFVIKKFATHFAYEDALYISQKFAMYRSSIPEAEIDFDVAMELKRFDIAYMALNKMSGDKQYQEHLGRFVTEALQHDASSIISRYTFFGHEADLRNCLESKALQSHWNSTPNYFKILFAYNTAHGDFHSAAQWMFAYSMALENSRDIQPWQSLSLQCKAYLACLNALELVPESERYVEILHKYRTPDTTPYRTLKEIKQIYLSKICKLELRRSLPSMESDIPLKPEYTLSLCVNCGLWERAVAVGDLFDLDFSRVEGSMMRLEI
eukprot:Partr_v1_DN28002_c2_g1_i2_m57165